MTNKQKEILKAVEEYMNQNPYARILGAEYVSQDDNAQVEAIELACKLASIYEKYGDKE